MSAIIHSLNAHDIMIIHGTIVCECARGADEAGDDGAVSDCAHRHVMVTGHLTPSNRHHCHHHQHRQRKELNFESESLDDAMMWQ